MSHSRFILFNLKICGEIVTTLEISIEAMSLPQLSCLNPYRYLMQKLFKETRSWATVLTTRLGVLNMFCRVGIAISVPLHTCGLLASCIPV